MSEKLNKDNAANQIPQRFTLDSFKRISNQMVATSEAAWTNNNSRYSLYRKQKEYTMEEIQKIINSNDTVLQAKLSRDFFYKDGFYKRILMYYATLLKYTGVLIPNPAPGKSLSEKSLQKRYYSAMEYVDRMSLSTLLTNFSIRALINGAYYGVLVGKDKHDFVVLDLPQGYCRTLFKDFTGNDIIEFDVSYFNTISNKESRQEALKLYPKVISSYYRLWVKDKVTTPWVIIPSDIGICFPFYDGAPLFLNIIPATIQYDEAVETERERELEEIRKIIVQKIPHLNDGGLLFEPDEAEVIHQGTVGMMKGNKNVSVLTTYADVDSIISRTSSEAANNALEKMVQKQEMTNASSIQNLIKNVGCAVGTSSVGFLVSSYSQIYQSYLVDRLSLLNHSFATQIHVISSNLMGIANSEGVANIMAQVKIYKTLIQQSTLCAFINAYRIYAILIVLLLPFVFMLKKFEFKEDKN